MGKRVKSFFRYATGAGKHYKKSATPRKTLITIISFILTLVLFTSISFAWFSLKTSDLEALNFQLDCGKGLRVNDTGTSQLSFSENTQYLIPASSVDGRNIYFPTDGSDFSSNTVNMTFRSANAGDKNQNYIQIDFSLTAQQNHTALYINEAKTSLRVAEQNDEHLDDDWSVTQAAALRSALWSSTAETGVPNTPIVFNPTASTLRTAAVEDVDRSTGAFISSGRQVAHAFSDYSFGGTPVATLERGVETKFSYIVWLEGTDPKCTEAITNKDIQIKLAFSTSWDKTETIRFKDETLDNWVSNLINNDHYTLTLHFEEVDANNNPTGVNMDFNMYQYNNNDNHVWSCNIPGDIRKNISFVLRPKGEGNVYKFTYSSKTANTTTYDRGSNRLYVAELGSTDTADFSKCRGYWMAVGDSDGAGQDSGSFDGDDF